METSLLILSCLSYGYVCILPFIFFRNDGKFNLMWILTAWPFTAYPLILLSYHFGYMSNNILFTLPYGEYFHIVAVILHVIAISLISLTLGTHRIPLALWHQENDAPKSIITFGAYAKFRHPFYTSFILSLVAGVITAPSFITIGITIYGITFLTITAKREEGRLSSSDFGQEYQDYMKVTGRFFPKLF